MGPFTKNGDEISTVAELNKKNITYFIKNVKTLQLETFYQIVRKANAAEQYVNMQKERTEFGGKPIRKIKEMVGYFEKIFLLHFLYLTIYFSFECSE